MFCCMNKLCHYSSVSLLGTREESGEKRGRRVREVVLLTDDRNLRVKALASELPTRDLPSFVQWAGLSCDNTISAVRRYSDILTV